MSSTELLLTEFDNEAKKTRTALAGLSDDAWTQNWKLSF